VSSDPLFSAALVQGASDLRAAWSVVASIQAADPGTPKWEAMATTLEAQWMVLVGPDPLTRTPAVNIDIGAPTAPDPAEDPTLQAADALSAARDFDLEQAKASTGLAAAFWASLACSAEQVRLGLTGPYNDPVPADPAATILVTDEATALTAVLSRYDEGAFAMRAAEGFITSTGALQRGVITARLTIQDDMASLADVAATAHVTVPTSQAVYELPAGRDDAAAQSLLASTQASLVESTASWVASAADPSSAIDYMMTNATLAMPVGDGTAQWPGWPDRA